MRIIVVLFLIAPFGLQAQVHKDSFGEKTSDKLKWKIDGNKLLTGGLIFVGGAAKGFNETLHFNYKNFENTFNGVNNQWFDPQVSWRNKYEGGNPDNGPKFFLSTSAFVMFTDQYHLNNFIHRTAILTALVIKIGEGKKPFKHYVYDLLYYTVCYQAGFSAAYYPFINRNPK